MIAVIAWPIIGALSYRFLNWATSIPYDESDVGQFICLGPLVWFGLAGAFILNYLHIDENTWDEYTVLTDLREPLKRLAGKPKKEAPVKMSIDSVDFS